MAINDWPNNGKFTLWAGRRRRREMRRGRKEIRRRGKGRGIRGLSRQRGGIRRIT